LSKIDWLLRWSPLQLISREVNRSRPAVLAFHGVDDPEVFAGLMDRVTRNYRPITIHELDRSMHGDLRLPDRSVLITFDDGHRSVLERGLPILAERGLPAVAFIVPGVLSTNDDFWWSAASDLANAGGLIEGHEGLYGTELVRYLKQIPDVDRIRAVAALEQSAGRPRAPHPQLKTEDLETLRSGGIEIGNHTWSHPCLNRCEPGTIETEITRAHAALEQALGEAPQWFAYPNGDWDQHAEQTLADLGYRLAFLFDHRMIEPGTDPLRASRLRVNSNTTPERFEIILSGLHPAIHRARGRS